METETTLPVIADGEIDIQAVLREFRNIIDQREALAAQDKELSQRKAQLENTLQEFHRRNRLNQIGSDSLSVSFDDTALRATYEPDRWPDIVKWAAATDNMHIVQRRLTDAKVLELVDNGVALPPGLSLQQYTKLNFRRK